MRMVRITALKSLFGQHTAVLIKNGLGVISKVGIKTCRRMALDCHLTTM
jgi:hypothetical protein